MEKANIFFCVVPFQSVFVSRLCVVIYTRNDARVVAREGGETRLAGAPIISSTTGRRRRREVVVAFDFFFGTI